MKRFNIGKSVELFVGNAIDIMKKMQSESIDLIFADPPYKLSNGGVSVSSGKFVPVHKGDWDVSSGLNEDFMFHASWIAECKRLLKPNGTLWVSGTYHSIYQCGFALQNGDWKILNEISWFKPNAAPNLSRKVFTASHETLIWAARDATSKPTFNYLEMKNSDFLEDNLKRDGKQMRSVWSIPSTPAREKTFGKHPTQKPLALISRIIRASSNPGDVVLDPFCGSGTTGESAIRNNRNFVGIEIDESFVTQIALPRLEWAMGEMQND